MKISINTQFWKQEKDKQIEKLVNLIYWAEAFLLLNIGYYIFQKIYLMMIFNTLYFLVLLLIIISYNKREKTW